MVIPYSKRINPALDMIISISILIFPYVQRYFPTRIKLYRTLPETCKVDPDKVHTG
jgi:hypothetical protein